MLKAARRAWRVLLMGAGLVAVGCKSEGSYQLRWAFAAGAPAMFAPGDCGKFGISAIAIAGTSSDGTRDNPTAACAPGMLKHGLPPGTWTLALTALDAEGHVKEPAGSGLLSGQTTVVVVEDQLAVPQDDPVLLPPVPQCRDGVDNDQDGRVDLDDPGCAGDPEGAKECGGPLPDMPCPGT